MVLVIREEDVIRPEVSAMGLQRGLEGRPLLGTHGKELIEVDLLKGCPAAPAYGGGEGKVLGPLQPAALELLADGRTGENIGAWVGEPVVLPPTAPAHRRISG